MRCDLQHRARRRNQWQLGLRGVMLPARWAAGCRITEALQTWSNRRRTAAPAVCVPTMCGIKPDPRGGRFDEHAGSRYS